MKKIYLLSILILFGFGLKAQVANTADSLALVALYNSTNGSSWANNSNWLTGNVATWYGITLDSTGRVTGVILQLNQLTGNIPVEISNLTALTKLIFFNNQLNGSIPPEIGNLTNLWLINLGGNQLTGSIPPEIGNLTKMSYLSLNLNNLTGSIPSEISNFTKIREVNLSSNQLTGSIPSEIGNLTTLEYLNLNNNQLTDIPDLSAITYLSTVSINNNQFDFGDLETANLLESKYNSYAPQANVIINRIEGGGSVTLSVTVGGTNNTYQWLRDNVVLTGETSNSITVANTADGIYYCQITNSNFPDLTIYSNAEAVGSASLTQGVITTEYNALILLYNATNGNNWQNNANWNTSEQVDLWYGVTVQGGCVIGINLSRNQLSGNIPSEIGNLTNLASLSLHSNQLSGSIPPEIGNLTTLEHLNLGNNQLTGSIPPEIGNLTKLPGLYLHYNQLSGNVPPEIGNLTLLTKLYLTRNKLSGNIPPEIGNLTKLTKLYLDYNQLSGNIPPEIANLTTLEYLYLDYNQLTGSIPIKIGNLTTLKYLNLNNNQLTGSIPPEIDNLTNLWSIKLHNNQLTGSIPPEVGDLTNLEYLNLNNNQLTGIPDLSALAKLSIVYINKNQFDFADLETANISPATYSYAPQANVNTNRVESGGNITLSVTVGGTNNSYQWFKDNVIVTGETTDSITVAKTVDGIYYCKITDSNFPDLILNSEPVTIIATYDISVSANPVEGGSVTGGGSYEAGQMVGLIAIPADGYVFVNWEENGTEV